MIDIDKLILQQSRQGFLDLYLFRLPVLASGYNVCVSLAYGSYLSILIVETEQHKIAADPKKIPAVQRFRPEEI